jgi:cardiolipin synthase
MRPICRLSAQDLGWAREDAIEEILRAVGSVTATALLTAFAVLELFALASVPSVLLRRRGRPASALAWLLALFALPALGGLAWWAFGRTRLERRKARFAQRRRDFEDLHGSLPPTEATVFDTLFPERARGRWAFATPGNRVTLLADGERFFPALEAAVAAAEESIHIGMYIFAADRVGKRLLTLLAAKAALGVQVRLLLDGFGSQSSRGAIARLLRGSGVELATFLPSRLSPLHAPRLNFTNHRKTIVIDERVAFTGGMNIAEEYESSWRDLMIRLEGPAVRGLHHVFLEDWHFATGQALPEPRTPRPLPGGAEVAVVASGPDSEPWIHDAYFLAITLAERSLDIVTPYFIPSQALLMALRTTAGRGVKVRLLLPGQSDVRLVKWASRSYYRQLAEAGVRVFEYRGRMLHAKALVRDEAFAAVGTANIDSRSMGLSFETACFIHGAEPRRVLGEWLAELFLDADEVTEAELDRKGTAQKLAESAAHLLSPLL